MNNFMKNLFTVKSSDCSILLSSYKIIRHIVGSEGLLGLISCSGYLFVTVVNLAEVRFFSVYQPNDLLERPSFCTMSRLSPE